MVRRAIAYRVQRPETSGEFQVLVKHRHSVTAVALSEDDLKGFSASKDGTIMQWDVNNPQGQATKHSKHVLALAISSDGRYLATGGLDRHVHLWDTRTREHIQVHEESRLVFRAPASSLECCCFVDNGEFLSGSDNGNIELWSIMRKKPVYIVRNAHAVPTEHMNSDPNDDGRIPNGHFENGHQNAESYNCSSAFSWVSAITVCRNSDLAASGAGNGSVRLWAIESETKDIKPLYDAPLASNKIATKKKGVGFVNSLAFAKSAQFLVAGVGQEPRLRRWGRIAEAQNGVAIHRLKLS
ncbi:hypothetical protein L6164_029626 [Bauhinia variegata]|uniref:Uncharacterized protein n=1 Tax=Bauhinia variegata TaxID=167791 RepID=A0ACB9L9T6_BAUVA|nr:hypothetical protein L6164_029626 [Bauhinia variegata]